MLPIQKVEELEESRCMQCTVCICGKPMEEMKTETYTTYRYHTAEIHTTVSDPHLSLLNSPLKSIPWEAVQVQVTPICLSFFPYMYMYLNLSMIKCKKCKNTNITAPSFRSDNA